MKKHFALTFLTLLALSLTALAQKPNIVVIVADDLGLGDIGRQHTERTGGAPLAPTPTLDSLADDGMWFTDAHSPCALCAPSRYAFMTGNYTYRSDHPGGTWGAFWQSAIHTSDMTLGRITHAAGYNTGFIGKWHLGGDFYAPNTTSIYRGNDHNATPSQVDLSAWVGRGPQDMGFDYDFTISTGVQGPVYVAHENASWYKFNAASSALIYLDATTALDPLFVSDKGPGVGDSQWDARALNILLADKAATFITNNAPSADPFFLYYCSPAVHIPWTPPTSIDGTSIAGSTPSAHLDMNRVLDFEVKRIVDALKASGEYDNTLIIFTSDNGGLWNQTDLNAGHIANGGGVSGYKNDRREGGTLVPFIAVWPDVIQSNAVCNSLINGTDILATLAAVIEQPFTDSQAMDSYNILPIFTNSVTYEPRAELLYQGGTGNELTFRQGKWKLTMTGSGYGSASRSSYPAAYLHNLATDPFENNNLVNNATYTNLVATMHDRYWDLREAGTRTAPSSDTPIVIPEPEIIYVDQVSGNVSNSGTNWSEALPTIASGIAAAGPNEHIWVAKGTYNEGTLAIPSGSTIYGGFSNGQTNINDRDFILNETTISPAKVQILDTSNIRFDGFTLTGATGNWDFPIRVDTSGSADVDDITVANCKITGNSVGATFLIRGWNGRSVGDVTIEDCEISNNNSSGQWLSILSANPISGLLTVRNCSVFSNTVAATTTGPNGAGITFTGGNLLVENCLFYGNLTGNESKSTGIHIVSGGNIKVVNSTFGNAQSGTANYSGLMRLDGGSSINIYNCIFAGSPQAALINSQTTQTTMSDCLFYNNTGNHIGGTQSANTEPQINALTWASDCIVSDPSFAGLANFALTTNSAAIDEGKDNELSAAVTTDLKGDTRVAGLHVDIGAYEIMDQDGDGFPDNYEMSHTSPQSPVALAIGSDDDGDGYGAFIEYAFGLSPSASNSSDGVVQAFTNITSEKYQTLKYRRSRSAMDNVGIDVLRTTDLTNMWSSGQTVITDTNAVDTDVDLITERSTTPISSQPKEFLKLEVSTTP